MTKAGIFYAGFLFLVLTLTPPHDLDIMGDSLEEENAHTSFDRSALETGWAAGNV